jgi:hypothetical protein
MNAVSPTQNLFAAPTCAILFRTELPVSPQIQVGDLVRFIGEHSPGYFPALELGRVEYIGTRIRVRYSFGYLYPRPENLAVENERAAAA